MVGRRDILGLIVAIIAITAAAGARGGVPEIGAQVWIEPGQRPEDVEGWFKTLAAHHMPVARLFIMWRYVEPERDRWDFGLYDRAFDAAKKHGVKIVATLESGRRPPHRGDPYQLHGNGMPETRERLEETRLYVREVVGHFRGHPALDAWSLVNEAQARPEPQPLAVERFRSWLGQRYGSIGALNDAWSTAFADFGVISHATPWDTGQGYWHWPAPFMDWYSFWREHLAWYLSELAREVRALDPGRPIHSHTAGQFQNLAEGCRDLPRWRGIADSLGGSFHPAWGFGAFGRDQLAMGMAYGCELVRGASEPKPFWVTELQGGANIMSGGTNPMTPSREDIAQWTWTGIGSGAARIIYWLLNDRLAGCESGEWSMLDYQGQPTDRLDVAGSIAGILAERRGFFDVARPVTAPVTIIVSQETLTLDLWKPAKDFPGRGQGAHMLSAYGFYRSLSDRGIPVRVKQVEDFPWRSDSQRGELAILPHVRVLTARQCEDIAAFVASGNTVLATGLTGFFDESVRNWTARGFPLREVFGGVLKEVIWAGSKFQLSLDKPRLNLPGHLFKGDIRVDGAEIIGREGSRVTAVRHRHGRGEAVWIPSLLGLGAWGGDAGPLGEFVEGLAGDRLTALPFRFAKPQANAVLRVLGNGRSFVTVVSNGSAEAAEVCLLAPKGLSATTLWGDSSASGDGGRLSLGPRQTVVQFWMPSGDK